jgi:predicted NBD/HSP70 family sugar kinase
MSTNNDQIKRRNHNRYRILREIFTKGSQRRTQMALSLSIRKSSVTSLTDELLKAKWINNIDPKRPRSPLQLDNKRNCALAISHETTKIRAALYALNGERIHLEECPIPWDLEYPALIETVTELARRVMAHTKRPPLLAGFAVPGVVDTESATILDTAHIPKISHKQPGLDLEKSLGIRCLIENDVRASLLGSLWFDTSLHHLRNALYIDITQGVSAALLVNGTLHKGLHNTAGEIGHIKTGRQGRRCHCGKKDCLETYISIPALAKSAQLSYPYTMEELLEKIDDEDLEYGLNRLSNTIRPIIAAIDPEVVLLGNQDPQFYQRCLPILKRELNLDIPLTIVDDSDSSALTGIASKTLDTIFTHGIGL